MRTPWGARIELLLDGRSQSWLATASGVGPSTLASIISTVEPKGENLVRIAAALGTSAEYLMTGEHLRGASTGRVAEPPAGWQPSQSRVRAIGDRVRQAELALEAASQETAIIPDEGLRQALLALQVRYGVELEDLALLLGAAHRAQTRRT